METGIKITSTDPLIVQEEIARNYQLVLDNMQDGMYYPGDTNDLQTYIQVLRNEKDPDSFDYADLLWRVRNIRPLKNILERMTQNTVQDTAGKVQVNTSNVFIFSK